MRNPPLQQISTFSQNKHTFYNKHTFFGLTKICLLWVGTVSYLVFDRCYFQNYFSWLTQLKIWFKFRKSATSAFAQNLLSPAVLGFEMRTYVIFSQSEDDCPVNFCLVNPHPTLVSKFSHYIFIYRESLLLFKTLVWPETEINFSQKFTPR